MKKTLFKKWRFCFRSICVLIIMSIQLSLGVSSSGIQAQNENSKQRKITGTVRDNIGEPLPGASVVVKGTKNGTVADLSGKFSLSTSSLFHS